MCKLWTISNVICLDYFTSSLPFHNLMLPFWPVIDTRTAALVLSLLSALSRCLSAISIVRPINSHKRIQRSSTNTELPERCVLLFAKSANFFSVYLWCRFSWEPFIFKSNILSSNVTTFIIFEIIGKYVSYL